MIAVTLLIQVTGELAADQIEMNAFAWLFMLVSMGAVTWLTIWSFWRILTGRSHFDPDGIGPASPPVPGRLDGE